jgi:hypothetical protein
LGDRDGEERRRMTEKRRVIKSLRFILFILLLCFLSPAYGQGANWVYFSEPDDRTSKEYYDADNITVTPDNTVRVRSRRVYSDSGRAMMLMERQKAGMPPGGYENLDALLALNELSCRRKEYRIISVETYERGGRLLDSVTFEDRKWKPVPPETSIGTLFKQVCNRVTKK